MPVPVKLPPPFNSVLAKADSPLIGAWVCSGSPVAAEIVASAGFDWLLIDGEHSPYGLETVAELLRATDVYGPSRIVRIPVNDTALIKQYLDLGAQNLMVPMVDTAADAQAAVAAMHYPPRGIRGVGSALARSSRWNGVENYLHAAAETISLTVQIESAQAVDNAAEIAAVDGVDQVFVGPSDLAASMGLLGQQSHPQVLEAVSATFDAVAAAGKPVGVNAFDEAQANEYLAAGASFVAVGADVQLLAGAARSLSDKFLQEG
ncbi:alpha-dehydro-beta-deoxy-D-glucarate aldolase [Corynebacterium phocae]|uniref:Alpha-dehydro-beta-deoxy-D-glucarate aldolase n=1 Tax=Corynebacterium phocae TaxID=161895 RepID=A0A1L7D5U7_9CORY|nr:HpcH/HpaI aldolase/citrate lyase family protein [Corynebacterium phocae]APT93519.1 alpha-dehydro-beta-deoxy-D-glucarate aldolase [Corynebacterium phocae]KAA8720600.1 HpcH/HpaI aldolase/citrate lyase family protein [Corynebacterium phocae]